MTTCKSKESCQNLLDLLALDHRYLTICDALPNHKKIPIPEAAAANASVLRDGDKHDDDSAPGSPEHCDGAEAAREGTPPTPPGKKKSQDDDFRLWLPLRPHSIAWNELGLSDADAPDRKNFVPACAFFFYIPELPTKYPDINNALHKHWHTKYKGPMKAADFNDAPLSFDEGEIDWFKANVELMSSRLSEDQRAERGIGGTARTKATAQAKAQAKAATAAVAAAAAAQAKAAKKAKPAGARHCAPRAHANYDAIIAMLPPRTPAPRC
jgi:hypothetical protein